MGTLPFADEEITRIRRETKLLLEHEEAERIASVLCAEATPFESHVVSVYFDTPDAKLARRAAATPDDCVKVRAKSYDPDLVGRAGAIVLDVKRERAGSTSKDRLWIAPEEVPLRVHRALVPVFGPLAPSIASSYRRRIFQCAPSWRVTIDDDLRFHAAAWDLFLRGARPTRAGLPPPFAAERRSVVELKHAPGALPEWLSILGRLRGAPYSKFAAGTADAEGVGTSGA